MTELFSADNVGSNSNIPTAPSGKLSISDIDGFEISEFIVRWKQARRAALVSTLIENEHDRYTSGAFDEQDELDLLNAIPETARDNALRHVFLNSRKLGQSAVKFYGVQWELSDLHYLLQFTGIPCVSGTWQERKDAVIARQTGCSSIKKLGSFVCDYWREAIDGLVMGVGDEERYARHASMGHGDQECLDIFFVENTMTSPGTLRWGKLPEDMQLSLSPIIENFAASKITLEFLGMAEGALFYTLQAASGPLCGASAGIWHQRLYQKVHEKYPDMRLQDAAPLAVYGEGTK